MYPLFDYSGAALTAFGRDVVARGARILASVRELDELARLHGEVLAGPVRLGVIPSIAPLATFVALVQLMDNFRVFEPIVGFNASANASSLSSAIFDDLHGQNAQLFGSAAATSMLTIIGVVILLTPVLIRTWREFSRKGV